MTRLTPNRTLVLAGQRPTMLLWWTSSFPSPGCVLSSEPAERRLTAILAADVAGYSRLIGADEEGTLAQLKAFRKTLVDPTITKHRRRIGKTTGDGMLVEFASAADAPRCADDLQHGMPGDNTEIPQPHRL